MNNVLMAHQWKWICAGWFLLYGIGLFLILFDKQRYSKDAKRFSIAMLIVLSFLQNPWLANYMIAHYMNNAKEFSRIGWSLLVVPVLAYLFTRFITGRQTNKSGRFPWVGRFLAVLALLFILDSRVQPYFRLPENRYKLPEEALEVAEILNQHAADADGNKQIGVLFSVGLGQGTSACEDVFFGIRHWDASMIFTETSVEAMEEAPQEDLEFLLGDHDVPEKKLQSLGFAKIGETASCDIYQRR